METIIDRTTNHKRREKNLFFFGVLFVENEIKNEWMNNKNSTERERESDAFVVYLSIYICLFVCLSHNMWIRSRIKFFFCFTFFFNYLSLLFPIRLFFPILSFNGFHKRRNQFQNFIFFFWIFPGFFFILHSLQLFFLFIFKW